MWSLFWHGLPPGWDTQIRSRYTVLDPLRFLLLLFSILHSHTYSIHTITYSTIIITYMYHSIPIPILFLQTTQNHGLVLFDLQLPSQQVWPLGCTTGLNVYANLFLPDPCWYPVPLYPTANIPSLHFHLLWKTTANAPFLPSQVFSRMLMMPCCMLQVCMPIYMTCSQG